MNLVGKVIGNRYEILEKIGEGGMATVYKARDNTLKRYVAVKVLRDEFITDDEFIKRFNSEAQAAASLTHPNIVSIYDVGHEETVHYIVMELVQGKTLKEIINEDGVLPWKWSVNIAIQVTSALETAHKNNIVHRDIKPHNIIITEDGIAKVTDFGIAKAVSNSTITAFGTTIGSVHYFSPEHARGGYTDAKSDIYSLGVVMYEMLTGRVPFDADTPVSIALKHMQEKAVEPIKLNPSIPYAINKIIIKAMEKDISLRYQSATELLKDLSLALKNPEGNFVKSNAENMQYTQRIPSIGDEITMEAREEKMKDKKKTGKNQKAKKIGITVAIICAIIIIPIAGFFGTQALLSSGQPKNIDLPDFVGKSVDEAKAMVEEDSIIFEIEETYDGEIEEGKIISQEPPYVEGTQVKEKTVVKLLVSKGTKMVTMKKVVGMKFEDAEKMLTEELELEVEKVGETSKTVEEGVIIKQEIEEGIEIKAGTVVKLTVSKGTGIKQVSVPYVIGETEADAKKKLSDLDVTVVYEEDTTKVDGKVLKQSIETGTTVDEKTKITITVNRIEKLKTGTIKLNLKSVLGDKATITKDPETGEEINPTIALRIEVNGDTVYKDNPRKDATAITATAQGKGTVNVKIFADDVKIKEVQFDLTKEENPVLTLD